MSFIAAARAAVLTEQALAFVHRQDLRAETFDVVEQAAFLNDLLRRVAGDGALMSYTGPTVPT